MLNVNILRKSAPAGDGGGAVVPQREGYRLPWQVYVLLILLIIGGG